MIIWPCSFISVIWSLATRRLVGLSSYHFRLWTCSHCRTSRTECEDGVYACDARQWSDRPQAERCACCKCHCKCHCKAERVGNDCALIGGGCTGLGANFLL